MHYLERLMTLDLRCFKAAKSRNIEIVKILIQQPGTKWELENGEGETALSVILGNKKLFREVLKEAKSYVSKLMTKKYGDSEVTKTPVIFALENNLREHIVKFLVAGSSTQDIVDLVLYSCK